MHSTWSVTSDVAFFVPAPGREPTHKSQHILWCSRFNLLTFGQVCNIDHTCSLLQKAWQFFLHSKEVNPFYQVNHAYRPPPSGCLCPRYIVWRWYDRDNPHRNKVWNVVTILLAWISPSLRSCEIFWVMLGWTLPLICEEEPREAWLQFFFEVS